MRQEKREQRKNRPDRELAPNDTFHSTILAGNVETAWAGPSQISSDSYYSAEALDDSVIAHRNIETNSATANSESPTGGLDMELNDSKSRDTNHNIDSIPEADVLSESPPIISEKQEKTSYMRFFLEKLSREIDSSPPSTTTKSANLMRGLAISFAKNREEFTDKLMTIIEETDLNICHHSEEKSLGNLSRLTTEFRKACKYIKNNSMIMDESMPPEMFKSPTDVLKTIIPRSPATLRVSNLSPKERKAVDIRTPRQENQKHVKKVYRKTPKNISENAQRSNRSPLCIATLKRANGTPQNYKNSSPIPQNSCKISDTLSNKSPHGNITPKNSKGTPKVLPPTPKYAGYNDSFTYWEDYAHQTATPESESKKRDLRKSKSVPDIKAQLESARIKRTAAIQFCSLEDSPPSSLYNIPRKTFAENVLYDTFDSHPGHDSNLPESVLEEVMKKRLRCYETEKRMRAIDATSISPDDTYQNDTVLEYLQLVTRSSDYHKYLIENKDVIQKAVKKIEEKRTGQKKITKSLVTPRKLDTAKNVRSAMSDLKRPAFVVNFRRRSPGAVRKSPNAKSPVSSKQKETSLYLRGLSAKKTTSASTSSVRHPTTPRITNRKLALTNSTPNLAFTPKSTPSRLRLTSEARTPARTLSNAKKTPSTLSIARTPAKINRKDERQVNSVKVQSKLFEARTPVRSKSSQNLPAFVVTPATPATKRTRDKNTSQNCNTSRVTNKLVQTSKTEKKPAITYRPGKVFNTPAKAEEKTCSFFATPNNIQKSSILSKRGKFFETPVSSAQKEKPKITPASKIKKPLLGRAANKDYDTIRSPVSEYIKSTDPKLFQNIRSHDDKFLLTPKGKRTATSGETLRIKLGKNVKEKKSQRESENDENIPDTQLDSFPKVIYQPSTIVHDIDCSPSPKLRGGQKVLREINDRRVVIRHEGRIQNSQSDQSIHISKPAQKSNYVGHSQTAKKPFK
ncbi:uncharacterized protein [Fopius arisanus]|uniref:Uncharacterized protein n=1 Tax=Fopius arisanus TaxID=64838 RepID=A0A9R1THW5_9HYME|nr:PREDICTED: uncharacterized protein LOC105270595 [Fopius arisanus]